MLLKHTLVRAALAIYFMSLFFEIYILNPQLAVTFDSLNSAFFALAVAIAVYFAISPRSVIAPLLLWCWIGVFSQLNPLAKEIHFDYMGWMLFYFVARSLAEKSGAREDLFYRAAILTFGTSYTASGLVKCMSSAWLDGRILNFIRQQGFFQTWTEPFTNSAGLFEFSKIAQATTGLELLALPMVVYTPTRFLIWVLLTMMQIGLLLSTTINHISALMLIFHALCFDPAWLPKREPA